MPSVRLRQFIPFLDGTRLLELELNPRNQVQDSLARRRAHDRTEMISQCPGVPTQVLLLETPHVGVGVTPRGEAQLEHAQPPHRQQRRDPWLPHVQAQALPAE